MKRLQLYFIIDRYSLKIHLTGGLFATEIFRASPRVLVLSLRIIYQLPYLPLLPKFSETLHREQFPEAPYREFLLRITDMVFGNRATLVTIFLISLTSGQPPSRTPGNVQSLPKILQGFWLGRAKGPAYSFTPWLDCFDSVVVAVHSRPFS